MIVHIKATYKENTNKKVLFQRHEAKRMSRLLRKTDQSINRIVQLMIYNIWDGHNKMQVIPDVSTIRTVQPVDSNMNHLAFNILMATGTKLLL